MSWTRNVAPSGRLTWCTSPAIIFLLTKECTKSKICVLYSAVSYLFCIFRVRAEKAKISGISDCLLCRKFDVLLFEICGQLAVNILWQRLFLWWAARWSGRRLVSFPRGLSLGEGCLECVVPRSAVGLRRITAQFAYPHPHMPIFFLQLKIYS